MMVKVGVNEAILMLVVSGVLYVLMHKLAKQPAEKAFLLYLMGSIPRARTWCSLVNLVGGTALFVVYWNFGLTRYVLLAAILWGLLMARTSTPEWKRLMGGVTVWVAFIISIRSLSWLLRDVAAVIFVVFALNLILNIARRGFVWLAAIGCGAAFLAARAVYSAPNIVDSVPTNTSIVFGADFVQVPDHIAWISGFGAAIGISDIILPGAMVLVTAYLGYTSGRPELADWAFLSFPLGWIGFEFALFATQSDQPTSLFLVPSVIIGCLWGAQRAGLLRQLLGLKEEPGQWPNGETIPS